MSIDKQPKHNPNWSMMRADASATGDLVEIFPSGSKKKNGPIIGRVREIVSSDKQPNVNRVIVTKIGENPERVSLGGNTAVRIISSKRK